MTNISQQQPINILKPLILSADKGSLSCVLFGQNTISVTFRVFVKLTTVRFAFCHSVTSFRFGKQCRVRKYRLSRFLFRVELECIEINVSQTGNPFLQC